MVTPPQSLRLFSNEYLRSFTRWGFINVPMPVQLVIYHVEIT